MALSETRLLSRPHRVHFAGFTSDTVRLQNAGWRLSAYQDVRGSMIQIAMKHEAAGCYMVADAQSFDYFADQRFDGGGLNFVVRRLSPDIVVQLMNVDFSKFEPIDAEPQFVEMKRQSIKDFNIFAAPLARTQEIIVEPQSVQECLDLIKKMQSPRLAEIRQRNAAREFIDQQAFHAQIMSVAA